MMFSYINTILRIAKNTAWAICSLLCSSLVFLFVVISVCFSCAPSPERRHYVEAPRDFGTKVEEGVLKIPDPKSLVAIQKQTLQASGSMATGDLFFLAENLIGLGREFRSPSLERMGHKMAEQFYQTQDVMKYQFVDGPYVAAAIGEGQADTVKLVRDSKEFLKDQMKIIAEILDSSLTSWGWPKQLVTVEQGLDVIETYARWFLSELRKRRIDDRIMQPLQRKVMSQLPELTNSLRQALPKLRAAQDFETVVNVILDVRKQLSFGLPDGAEAFLTKSKGIASSVNKMRGSRDGLVVLVDLWDLLPASTRQSQFQSVSPELYRYFSEFSDDEFSYLKSNVHSSKFQCLTREIFRARTCLIQNGIMNEISRYGVPKLKKQINTGVVQYVNRAILDEAQKKLTKIPGVLKSRIATELSSVSEGISFVEKDFPQFIKGIGKSFSDRYLAEGDSRLTAAEVSSARLDFSLNSSAQVRAEGFGLSAMSDARSSAEAFGSGFSLAVERWWSWNNVRALSPLNQVTLRSNLTQINKVLATGGFKLSESKNFPAYSVPMIESQKRKTISLREMLSSEDSFGVSDSFKINSDLSLDSLSVVSEFSVRGQASLLRGLSRMANYFRDWLPNSFDQGLGSVKISDLDKRLPTDSVNQPFFAKESIFAASIANASVMVKNLSKKMSPVFLVSLGGKITWSNDFSFGDGDQAAVMAGVVDIKSGQRSKVVNVESVSRYLLALTEYLAALEGIESTGASQLTDKDAKGVRGVDMLVDARSQIRLLVVAFANFLSHYSQSKDGGIGHSYLLTDQDRLEPLEGQMNRVLIDQVWAIRALTAAGQVLKMNIYKWAALDAFNFMNRQLWDEQTAFYREGEAAASKPPKFDELVLTLRTLQGLRAEMQEENRQQWDAIVQIWLKGLNTLR